MYGIPTSDNLEKAVYELDGWGRTVITPKAHTAGVPKTFYVFPIDPKTGEAVTDDTSKTFRLTIWEKATGFELIQGNGEECKKSSNGNYILSIGRNRKWESWSIRVMPEYAKPHEFTYVITGDRNIDGNTYAYFTDWEYTGSKNTFTIHTRDIGAFYGNKSNSVTFTSKTEPSITGEFYITILK